MVTNVGGGMNLNGVFTAPTAGTYMFTNSGLGINYGACRVYLQVGSNRNISSYALARWTTYSLQAVLTLNAGDKVSLYLAVGAVGDYYSNTHFTGIQLA